MPIQTINIGNLVNDGLGDDLRTAFQKVNSNFSELYYVGNMTAANSSSTIGTVIFKEKVDINGTSTLVFKTLLNGDSNLLDITSLPDSIRLTVKATKAFSEIVTNDLTVNALTSGSISLKGGIATGGTQADIEVSASNLLDPNAITIKNVIPVTDILTTFDFGNLGASPTNVVQLMISSFNLDFGLITLPSDYNLDYGPIVSN